MKTDIIVLRIKHRIIKLIEDSSFYPKNYKVLYRFYDSSLDPKNYYIGCLTRGYPLTFFNVKMSTWSCIMVFMKVRKIVIFSKSSRESSFWCIYSRGLKNVRISKNRLLSEGLIVFNVLKMAANNGDLIFFFYEKIPDCKYLFKCIQ